MDIKKGSLSPWGKIESVEPVKNGIFHVKTVGLECFAVSRELGHDLSPAAKKIATNEDGFYWFRKDNFDHCVLFYEFKIPGWEKLIKKIMIMNLEYAEEVALKDELKLCYVRVVGQSPEKTKEVAKRIQNMLSTFDVGLKPEINKGSINIYLSPGVSLDVADHILNFAELIIKDGFTEVDKIEVSIEAP